MKRHLIGIGAFLLVALVGVSACGSSQLHQRSIMAAKLRQLVTVNDVAELSKDLGILLWTLDEEFVGEYRVCRTFYGQSWSINRNLSANCIWQMTPGMTFDETIDWLESINALPASAASLESAYDYADDFGLYGYLRSNGHSVYDAFLLKDGFLYWAEIDVGTPGGLSPASLFTSKYGEPVDAFLHSVLMKNVSKDE